MNPPLEFTRGAEGDLDKFDKRLLKAIRDVHLSDIMADPIGAGAPLQGVFQGLRKYKFHHGGVSYRIVYALEPAKVLVFMIGPRQNFYDRLRRRLLGS